MIAWEQFAGASNHPLLTDWVTWIRDQEYTWASEYRVLAGRALALACNDPFIAALAQAHVIGTLGPVGLRHSSLFDDTPALASTTARAKAIRREINAMTQASWYGYDLDAEGVRSRLDLETALCWIAFVTGEGIAIRVTDGTRSRWRLIDAWRVTNPKGRANDDTMRDGFQTDESGRVTGIWVNRSRNQRSEPIYIPWTAADGTPNVIHRVGLRLPGMMRGVTRLAPMIVMSRQLSGVLESHVAAKRLQAVHGMVVEAESVEEYEQAKATGDALTPYSFNVKGPLNVWVKAPGQTVDFPKTEFSGDDLTAYLTLMYKIQCAVVQYPVDVVLCQMGNASLSSARAGLDQFDRTCQGDQERHIAECTSVIDRTIIADATAAGLVDLGIEPALPQAWAGKYARPPKYSTDRLKDANTIAALMAAGVSGPTAFEMFGLNWEDEQEIRAACEHLLAAQQLTSANPSANGQAPPTSAPVTTSAPAAEDQLTVTAPDSTDSPEATPQARLPWWRRILAHRLRSEAA